MGYGNGMEAWVTWQWPQSDLEMVQGTFENLYGKSEAESFDVYYMSVSGHSDYSPGENAMGDLHWDEVKDLPYSDPVKGYLAANIELDRAMSYLIEALERKGMADHTLIVIGADHFPYGLDDDGPLGYLPLTSELYGFDVTTYFERDHNRLIMWCGDLEDDKPIVVSSPTSSLDILPTLLNLFGLEWDSRLLPGRDVFGDRDALAFNLNYDWKTDLGTYFASYDTFEPAEGATVPAGYVEAMNVVVDDKVRYCEAVLDSDYFRHVFGDPEDVDAMNAAGKAAREAEEADEEELEEGTGRWGEDIVRRFEARYGTEYNADGTRKGSSKKDSGKKP
jgi:lipoteichoic acid synthase